ncbi:MAG: ATP-binding protein [Chlamydiales bacterium]|nr:ATP-binding protein [Chlamydiales bacterium]
MTEYQLDPDELLKAIQKDESKKKFGELKIFFGMAAGVGKTFAMLEDAHQCKKEGVDVWIGIVNSHGRVETEKLIEGLPRFPEKWVTYKDVAFEELDIDSILERKPQLVLVDELAHTNVPGSRHPKRWQDVIELLDAGINVYTAMNVQHLESRKDLVESITGVSIRETVPDLIIERATAIELVDIPPSKLLQRFREGKVYTGNQPQIAIENFFREDNLSALREIALRFTAEKVDHDLHDMLIAGKGWRTRERLMVAISSSPTSEQVIRAARRLAFELHAPWIAVYVNMGGQLSKEAENRLNRHFALARSLGAEVITTHDVSISSALTRISRQKNVTRIVVGRHPQKKSLFRWMFSERFVEHLEEDNKTVDIVILRQPKEDNSPRPSLFPRLVSPAWAYWLSVLSVLFFTLVGFGLSSLIGYKAVGFIFLFDILILSFFMGLGPIMLAAALSAVSWNLLFIPPVLEAKVTMAEDMALLVLYFLAASIVGILTSRIRRQDYMLQIREDNIEQLYDIARAVAKSTNIQELRLGAASLLKNKFGGDFDILTKSTQGQLVFDGHMSLWTQEIERSAALWAFQNGKIAGWSTDTLPAATALYVPIKYNKEVVGIIAYSPQKEQHVGIDQINFLQNVSEQLGIYLHRYIFEMHAKSDDYMRQVEKLQQAIFRSLSRGFYGPLEKMFDLNRQVKKLNKDPAVGALLDSIDSTSKNLKMIVDNVLTLAVLESGSVRFDKQNHSIRELVDACLTDVKAFSATRKVDVFIPEQDFFFAFDLSLMKIALSNVVLNALEYSPSDKPVSIEASIRSGGLRLAVLDRGPGIPAKILPFIFDKFYRVPTAQWQGMGLGLTIVKTVMEMHQGQIEIKDRDGGGTEFVLYLGETVI